MSEPRLISSCLAVFAARLPASVAEELADGLAETYRFYLGQGLTPGLAAETAVAEFGDPHVIVAEFVRVNPARRAARKLLGIGPGVGVCWAVALISGRAWAWPVPVVARVLLGLALIAVVGLLAAAALGRCYRQAERAGVAGCLGMGLLDLVMIIGVAVAVPSLTWVTATAMVASAARLAFNARALRPVLGG